MVCIVQRKTTVIYLVTSCPRTLQDTWQGQWSSLIQDASIIGQGLFPSPTDGVSAIYLLGAWWPLQVEVRVTVCALGVNTAFYTPLGTTSLEDSLHHSNNSLVRKHAIGGSSCSSTWQWPIGPSLPALFKKVDIYSCLKIEWGPGDKCN